MDFIMAQTLLLVTVCIMFVGMLFFDWKLRKKIKNPPPKIGRIVIDHSDPDGPHAFLEIDKGCYVYFEPGNEVLLDIVAKDYLED